MRRATLSRQDGLAIALIAAAHLAACLLLQLRAPVSPTYRPLAYLELVRPSHGSQPIVPMVPMAPLSVPEVSAQRAPIRSRARTAPAAPQVPASPEEAIVPESVAPAQDRAPMTLNADPGVLERARSMAGKIDHDLRAGQAPVSSEPADTPMKRFRQGIESAYQGGGASFVTDRYVAADGVVITRMIGGNGARCFISELVNASPAAVLNGKIGGARELTCPSGNVAWQRQ